MTPVWISKCRTRHETVTHTLELPRDRKKLSLGPVGNTQVEAFVTLLRGMTADAIAAQWAWVQATCALLREARRPTRPGVEISRLSTRGRRTYDLRIPTATFRLSLGPVGDPQVEALVTTLRALSATSILAQRDELIAQVRALRAARRPTPSGVEISRNWIRHGYRVYKLRLPGKHFGLTLGRVEHLAVQSLVSQLRRFTAEDILTNRDDLRRRVKALRRSRQDTMRICRAEDKTRLQWLHVQRHPDGGRPDFSDPLTRHNGTSAIRRNPYAAQDAALMQMAVREELATLYKTDPTAAARMAEEIAFLELPLGNGNGNGHTTRPASATVTTSPRRPCLPPHPRVRAAKPLRQAAVHA
jgi:hypothetical protein